MANKPTLKVKVNKERFMKVLSEKNSSIRQLGKAYNEIQRTEKTIRLCLQNGEMPPDLLDNIARYLNVDPDYLAGVYDERANREESIIVQKWLKQILTPERYPYILKAQRVLDYSRHFNECLIMNSISIEQFKSLSPGERVQVRQEMALAIYRVIASHFPTDSLGKDTQDELLYLESAFASFDPFSPFAEMEGIGIDENLLALDDDIDGVEVESEDDYFSKKYSYDQS